MTEGRNSFEKLFWVTAILLGFSFNVYMIMQSVRENYDNPILTTVDTKSVKEVPFPAITVDSGVITNPWGYIEKVWIRERCLEHVYVANTS